MAFSLEIIENLKGPEVMTMDALALEHFHPSSIRVAAYTWPVNSISTGCLFDPWQLLDSEAVSSRGWHLYQRPTGGGLMFHGKDLCFSLVVGSQHPLFSMSVLDSYYLLHQKIIEWLVALNPSLEGKLHDVQEERAYRSSSQTHKQSCCMAQPTIYDLTVEGKKVLGSAQRRRKCLLHQISLGLDLPEWDELKKLFRDRAELATIMRQNYGALGCYLEGTPEGIARELAQRLGQFLQSAF